MQQRKVYLLWLVGMMFIVSPGAAQIKGAGSSVFQFLSLPYSSRMCALGGDNVAIQDGDISMAMSNPALLCASTDRQLQLNFAYYMKGTMLGSALFGWNFGRSKIELHPDEPDKPNYFAVGIHYLDYGKMRYADEFGQLTGGSFAAKDMLIDIMYARQLGTMFTVGAALKPIYSHYESYHAFALAADVGGHFHTADSALHIGLTLRNMGWQLKGFYTAESGQHREALQFNLEVGISYRIKHAPIRLSMTIHNMQTWCLPYEYQSGSTFIMKGTKGMSSVQKEALKEQGGVTWYDMMFRHTIFALDIVPASEKFYLTLSYNHRRRAEMQLKDQRSLAGFALGAGVKIKMVRVGFALSQYTKSNLTYQASLSLDINQLMK